MEQVKAIVGQMGASDWRNRQQALREFKALTEASPHIMGNNIVKVCYNVHLLRLWLVLRGEAKHCQCSTTRQDDALPCCWNWSFQKVDLWWQLSGDCVTVPALQIFDKFAPCLKDSNSKVNLQALQVLKEVTPLLRDYLSGVLTITIQNVTVNLSSKNRDIFVAASDCLDEFMEHLGELNTWLNFTAVNAIACHRWVLCTWTITKWVSGCMELFT